MPFFGKTRMFKAIRNNDIATVRKVLDDGYWLYAEADLSNTNAPMLAVIENKVEILDLFFQYMLDYMRCFHYWGGQTMLHVACRHGRTEMVKMLLKKDEVDKSLPTMMDYSKETALHVAAHYGQKECFELLLQAGFDPYLKNGSQKSAVGIAYESGRDDIVALAKEPLALPAPVVVAEPDASEGWKLLSPERVAFVSVDDAIGYKLTEVFNFAMRERRSFSFNLVTNNEQSERVPFDDHLDKTPLEVAHRAYAALGGKIAKDVIYNQDLNKQKPASL